MHAAPERSLRAVLRMHWPVSTFSQMEIWMANQGNRGEENS